MQGCIVYNYSLKTKSYTENIRLFAENTKLPAFSNREMMQIFNKKPGTCPFDYCIFLDKDIALARYMEKMGIFVYNSSETIRVCDNKAYTHVELFNCVNTPKTFISPLTYYSTDFKAPLSYPFVLKECYGSWGAQVYLVHNQKDFEEVLLKIGNKPFIMQEYIEACGTDFRLYTIGGKVVGAMQRKNENDFRANCELGGVASAIEADDGMIEIAERVSQILNLSFGGIDLLRDKNGKLYFIEANSSAQAVQFQKVTGINIPKLVFNYIKKELDF